MPARPSWGIQSCVGDLDGDGDLDLAATNTSDYDVSILINLSRQPEPTITPEPTCTFGVQLEMPDVYFCRGDECWLQARVCRRDSSLPSPETACLFVFLDIGTAEYWFWPRWMHYPPDIDYQSVTIGPGEGLETFMVIDTFTWPNAGSGGPFWFHGALVDQEMTRILGDLDTWEFSYGPCPES